MSAGDCFEVALMGVKDDETVVHGLPIGRGKANGGARYWHAWIEQGDWVRDYSNGLKVDMPRAVYYAIGKIDPAMTWRYSKTEAWSKALEVEHFGPWVEGWEGMGL